MDGSLRQLLRRRLPLAMWVTVETGLVSAGVPDCWCCFPGGAQAWVECKLTHGWAVDLRPAQVGWLLRASRMGAACHVAVRRVSMPGPRARAADELWLVHGSNAATLRRLGLRKINDVEGRWEGGPSGWAWDEVGRLLSGA